MIKYIQDTIIRSRLTLTYRMHIDGKPVDEKLPFRLLVLGDFSGLPIADRTPLAQRKIIRIPKGTRYQDALASADDSRGFAVRFDAPASDDPTATKPAALKPLLAQVQGTLSGSLTATVNDATPPVATLTGTLTLEGKRWKKASSGADHGNGLGDFTGKITVPIDFTIDATQLTGAEVDSPDVILEGRVTGELSGDVKTPAMKLKLTSNKAFVVGGDQTFNVKVKEQPVSVTLSLPITNLDSFTPDAIGNYVPEIRRLRVIEGLLLELRSTLLTTPALKKALMKLVSATGPDVESIWTSLSTSYPDLKIKRDTPTVPPAAAVALPPKALELAKTMFAKPPTTSALVHVTEEGAVPTIALQDRNIETSDEDRFLNSLAAFFVNLGKESLVELKSIATLTDHITVLTTRIEGLVNGHLTSVLQSEPFRTLEKNWRGLAELCADVADDLVEIDVLDVTKDELQSDLVDHDVDIMTSDLFRKIYHDEYDRYGGNPYGVIIGLYSFDCTKSDDLAWIQTMSKVANLAHCPFIAAAKPEFFGCDTMAKVEAIVDLDKLMDLPKYGKWNAFRQTDGAGYIGLTLPGYLLRTPWGAEDDQPGNRRVKYHETKRFLDDKPEPTVPRYDLDPPIGDAVLELFRERDAFGPEHQDGYRYLWGNPAILFARNLVRSFQLTGWCQRIRGERGGGLIEGLTVHSVDRKGRSELQPPVEMTIPDFRELQFSNNGFIPLVWRKNSNKATFFGARSTKKALEFQDEKATQNADLVCNLAYTFSITRIAHYVKLMARPYIGTTADANYLQTMIETWLKGYVTTTVNPDDLTVQRYPFRAITVEVKAKPGPLGWYTSIVSILPHVQFEGMDVELRLEAALGGAK